MQKIKKQSDTLERHPFYVSEAWRSHVVARNASVQQDGVMSACATGWRPICRLGRQELIAGPHQ